MSKTVSLPTLQDLVNEEKSLVAQEREVQQRLVLVRGFIAVHQAHAKDAKRSTDEMPGRSEVLSLVTSVPNKLWHRREAVEHFFSKDTAKRTPAREKQMQHAVGNALQGLKDTGKLTSWTKDNFYFHTFWGPLDAFDGGQPKSGWTYNTDMKMKRK